MCRFLAFNQWLTRTSLFFLNGFDIEAKEDSKECIFSILTFVVWVNVFKVYIKLLSSKDNLWKFACIFVAGEEHNEPFQLIQITDIRYLFKVTWFLSLSTGIPTSK